MSRSEIREYKGGKKDIGPWEIQEWKGMTLIFNTEQVIRKASLNCLKCVGNVCSDDREVLDKDVDSDYALLLDGTWTICREWYF